MQKTQRTFLGIAVAVFALAALPEMTNRAEAESMQNNATPGKGSVPPVNKRFDTLRDFLDWQNDMHERIADFPWYEETSPGLFRLHVSRGQKPDLHEYTESELREKFGFEQ